MRKIYVAGIDVTKHVAGLDGINISFVLNQVRMLSYTISGTLEFSGAAYDLIQTAISDIQEQIPVTLDVEGLTGLNFVANARGIALCGSYAEVKLEVEDEAVISYDSLTKKILSSGSFWSDMASGGHTAPIPYCYEPNFVMYFLLMLFSILYPIYLFLGLVVSIFDSDNNIDTLGDWATGCPRYHLAVNLHEAIKYRVEQAGLSYQSYVTGQQYRDIHLLDAYGTEGFLRRKGIKYKSDQIINYTVPQILEFIAPLWNADFRVINSVVVFEGRRWFAENAFEIKGEVGCAECVEIDESQLNSYTEMRFEPDYIDEAGHKIRGRYDGIIDNNPNNSRTKRGGRTISPRVASSRFNDDGQGEALIVTYRKGQFIGSSIKDDLILSRGSTGTMRLLDLKYAPGGYRFAKREGEMYQPRLSFLGTDITPGLYRSHYESEEPENETRYTTDEIVIKPYDICSAIEGIISNGMNVFVMTERGRAIPESIEYDGNGTIVFQNCTIWP